ncbi:hypothetical protein CI109_103333 [Kwoniella shandongensis]|uniref:Uncharacterized protein n=1 Tax=Kwoniella shandongensis TaxID=1734106 RepID=A0A5M6BWP2_9TREE|nr:uncharacterized protein CI109_004414 [Kwoniella shandongensis]KAA5527123.1 hypothetical protein CI109_004414 [Kwoniella shandongensis]
MTTNEHRSVLPVPELESGTKDWNDGNSGNDVTHRKRSWWYSTLNQAFIIGLVAFLGPGMYNALGGLGAGGLASTTTWNNATALLFAMLCVSCVFAPILINLAPLKYTLAVSACTYAIYAASLYCNSKNGNEWFLVLANAINGIGSGLFFATEGAVVIGYPEPEKRGRYISIWVFMRNLGPIVGGAILLGLNISTKGTGSVSLNSYAAIMSIMCLCPFVALLLASPERVQRKDGSKIVVTKTNAKTELKRTLTFLSSRKVLLLLPIFFTSWFYDSYISTFGATYFTVRSRALSSFLTPFAGNIGSILVGWILDSKYGRRSIRARYVFVAIIVFQFALWIWTAILQSKFDKSPPKLDWTSAHYGRAYAMVFFWNLEGLAFQSFLYWLTGTLTNGLHELVHLTGILRGIEGAGQAVAYGLAGSSASKFVHIGLAIGLVVVSSVPAWLVVREVPDQLNHEQVLVLPVGVNSVEPFNEARVGETDADDDVKARED